MGKKPRPRPEKLSEKLLQIRNSLGLSQSEIFWRLDIEKFTEMKRISDFETGRSEPPLQVLLRYARLVRISTDILIDDEIELPARLKK
jgi:transcriptional regulator with XRE-family HTH domain